MKNLLELKNARRVLIEGNLSSRTAGLPRSRATRCSSPSATQEGRAPWATIEDVTFRNNIVKHSAGGINILGFDNNAPSRTASDISIENNLFDDINHREWGGNGLFLQIGNGAANVVVDHNTVVHTGNLITAYGAQPRDAFIRFPASASPTTWRQHNAYGIFGNGVGLGNQAITAYFPDSVFASNVLAGGQAVPLSGRELLSFGDAVDGGLHRRGEGRFPAVAAKRLSPGRHRRRRSRRQPRPAQPRTGGSGSVTGSSSRCSLIL